MSTAPKAPASGRPPRSRSLRCAATPWNRWLYGPGSDGVLCVSPGAAQRNERLRGGRPLAGAFGAVDTERFHPAPRSHALAQELGLAPSQRVVGIVARAQRHRRFDLLLEAIRELAAPGETHSTPSLPGP